MLDPVRLLFAEFADAGGADLSSPAFLAEIAGLPGDYSPPAGRLIAAFEAAHLAGCGAFRDAGDGLCELCRVYVREEYRNGQVERRILMSLLTEAQAAGYDRVFADPAMSMANAADYMREVGFSDDATLGGLRLTLAL